MHPDATVTLDDHLPGRFTEKKRQIDVSIRWTDSGHEQLTIVQARDRSRPADVNAVGEFIAVIEDVGASRGILVCRSGFTKNAKTYARNKGVELYNLHDAESRDWRLELTIPLLWIDLHPSADFPCRIHLNKGEQPALEDNGPILPIPEGPGFTRPPCSSSSGTSGPSPTPLGPAYHPVVAAAHAGPARRRPGRVAAR